MSRNTGSKLLSGKSRDWRELRGAQVEMGERILAGNIQRVSGQCPCTKGEFVARVARPGTGCRELGRMLWPVYTSLAHWAQLRGRYTQKLPQARPVFMKSH